MLITLLILLLSQVVGPDSVHSKKISSTHMVTADALCLAVRVPSITGNLVAPENATRHIPVNTQPRERFRLWMHRGSKQSRVGTVFRRKPQSALQAAEAHQIPVPRVQGSFCTKNAP